MLPPLEATEYSQGPPSNFQYMAPGTDSLAALQGAGFVGDAGQWSGPGGYTYGAAETDSALMSRPLPST